MIGLLLLSPIVLLREANDSLEKANDPSATI